METEGTGGRDPRRLGEAVTEALCIGVLSALCVACLDSVDTLLAGFSGARGLRVAYVFALELSLGAALGAALGAWLALGMRIWTGTGMWGKPRAWLGASWIGLPWSAFAAWVPSRWIREHDDELDASGRAFARATAPLLIAAVIVAVRVGIALRLRLRRARITPRWLTVALLVGWICLAAACYVADRRVLVGLYPDFHWGLTVSFATATTFAVMACQALWPALRAPRLRARALSAAGLAAFGALWALELTRPAAFGPSVSVVFDKLVDLGRAGSDFDGDGVSGLLGGSDCDGFDARVAPGNFDMPGDGVDEDCSGKPAEWPVSAATRDYAIPNLEGANLVLISIDALRADHLGCYGYARHTSPALDALAARSIRFARAMSAAPKTFDSFPALMSGLYVSNLVRHYDHPGSVVERKAVEKKQRQRLERHVRDLAKARARGDKVATSQLKRRVAKGRKQEPSKNWYFVADDVELLAATLKARGYTTAFLGASQPARSGLKRGFNSFQDRRNAEAALAFIEARRRAKVGGDKKPFFLWMHEFEPHATYEPHAGHDFGDEPIDRYDGEIAFVDAKLARVLAALEDPLLAKDTLIVVIADHGEEFGDHGAEFHGDRLYREHIHVPLLMHIPGHAGAVVEEPVELVGVLPTLCELLKLHSTCDRYDGRSLLANIAGVADPDRGAYSEAMDSAGRPLVRSLYTSRFHLLHDLRRDRLELYDVRADWSEHHDLAATQPKVTQTLLERMATRTLARQSVAVETYRKGHDANALARALGIFMQPAMLRWAIDELARHRDAAHAPHLKKLAARPGLPKDLVKRARRMVKDAE